MAVKSLSPRFARIVWPPGGSLPEEGDVSVHEDARGKWLCLNRVRRLDLARLSMLPECVEPRTIRLRFGKTETCDVILADHGYGLQLEARCIEIVVNRNKKRVRKQMSGFVCVPESLEIEDGEGRKNLHLWYTSKMQGSVAVKICSIGNHLCEFDALGFDTVYDLKTKVKRRIGILEQEQRYIIGSRVLSDRDSLHFLAPGGGTSLSITLVRIDPERAQALTVLPSNGFKLRAFSRSLRDDVSVVLTAVSRRGTALQFASRAMRGNKEVVMVAVQQDGYALKYVAEELRSDRQVVLAALNRNGRALQWAARSLRFDEEMVLAAQTENHSALEFAYK
eukprot:gnl/TRDRNA2_/TRDRNA2_87604_c0_seq2.p1 gnl/TRDRNA2_/TRDRNA2_87604_c0~~gnl/TRDRNA2_/TRDRNA2_87604_c0_seq2.p1  ORF type:complete len:336 (-),score=52.97 gnl/TRDRNA2_/TRDRNA2_87604_c0_seq2:34-1041(-)